MINSTTEDYNSTCDAYEKEFERVMQEQEKLETCGRNAETVTTNCDTSNKQTNNKQSVSPVISRKYFIPINYAPCQLNSVQSSTQGKKNHEPSSNKTSASAAISGGGSFIPIDCAPCQLTPVQIQTPTEGRNNSEPSSNKTSASAAISGGGSFIPIDCAPCQLTPVQIQTPTEGRNNSELSSNKTSASAAISGGGSSIQINLKKPPSQATIKTHQALGNCELSRNDSRIDYPPELNPFSDDDETERVKSTNPFGDSDEEENALLIQVIPPKPRPRHSFSTVKGLEHRNRLPVPLPRTASKSMPTTPNQSPLLRVSHSFRLPSPGASTYNSIRRKKKPAPPPPIHSIPDSLQSPIAPPKTNIRPRKTRLAPPPPKPATPLPS